MELVFVLIWVVAALLWMSTKGGDRFGNRTEESTRHYWREIDNRRDPWK